jgi:hypothetical protein
MRVLDRVVALNLSLVMAHQADAAYWKEWEMFGLPGGIQLFTLFNLAAFLLLLWLYSAVISRQPTGLRGSFLIAGLSGVVLPIHAAFAFAGFTEFHLPVSIAVIIATFVVSIWQAILTWRARREFEGGGPWPMRQIDLN